MNVGGGGRRGRRRINRMQNTVRYMRFGKGADCAAVAMLVNEALSADTVNHSKDTFVNVDWFIVSSCVCRHTHRPPSPVPSCVSMKSDQSMPEPISFSSGPAHSDTT